MADIQIDELKDRLGKGENFNFIDVREEWEYDEDNLGAKLIPLGTIPDSVSELESMKDQEIVIHCKSGGRSGQAQKYLQQQGFSNVRNLIGGITAYRAKFGN